jgi:tRNA(fMet)-specific endonuclease VapC
VAVLIDTDLLVDMGHGVGSPEVERILGEEDCAISVITVSELLHGVHRATGARRTRRSAFVEHLLAGLPSIPITDRVARVHAGVWAELAERGQVIGAHDRLGSAECLDCVSSGRRAESVESTPNNTERRSLGSMVSELARRGVTPARGEAEGELRVITVPPGAPRSRRRPFAAKSTRAEAT